MVRGGDAPCTGRILRLCDHSLLQGLEQRLRDECQMPCQLAESPLTCVAVGSGISLEEVETIHRAGKNNGARPRR
jgi:rod shape-determining protein MreB